jgi:hypothetical protein
MVATEPGDTNPRDIVDREPSSVVIYSQPGHVPLCCSRSSCQLEHPVQVDSRSDLDAIDQGLFVRKGHRRQLPSGPGPFKVEHIGAARRTKPTHKVQLAEKSASFEVTHDPVLPGDHLQPAVRGNRASELTVPR